MLSRSKAIGILLFCLVCAQSVFADSYRFQNAYIELSGKSDEFNYKYGHNLIGDLNQAVSAKVIIIEHDDNNLTERKTIIPVIIRTKDDGLNLKGLGDNVAYFNLIGLSGRKISDIFGVYGGLIGSIGFLANLGGFFAYNDQGIKILDGEQIFAATAGIKIAKRTLIMVPDDGSAENNIESLITGKDGGAPRVESSNMETLMNRVIKK